MMQDLHYLRLYLGDRLSNILRDKISMSARKPTAPKSFFNQLLANLRSGVWLLLRVKFDRGYPEFSAF